MPGPHRLTPLVLLLSVALVCGAARPAAITSRDGHAPGRAPAVHVAAEPVWQPDLTPRQGRVLPGDGPLPLREPGPDAGTAALLAKAAGPGPDPAGSGPTSDGIGLEKFYQYTGGGLGPSANVQVNQANGNAVVSLTPLSIPGRGLSTFVELSYNSQDPTGSPAGTGWSLAASTLTPVGQYLRAVPGPGLPPRHDLGGPIGSGMPRRVLLVDADGTGHLFVLDRHGSADPRGWDYDSPAGVHLRLQRTGSADPSRMWVFTRPDRTQFFYGPDGLPSAVTDHVGNTMAFGYDRPPGMPGRRLTDVVDPSGRHTLRLGYDRAGELVSLTDLAGRVIALSHDRQGRLTGFTEAAGTPVQRSFGFEYSPATWPATVPGTFPVAVPVAVPGAPNGAPNGALPGSGGVLRSVTDPLGHRTVLGYYPPTADPLHRDRVSSLTDRRGATTTFDYAPVPTGSPGALLSTVTDADRHSFRYLLDERGRVLRSTDPLGRATDLAWDAGNNVVRLREPDGATSTWVYDPRTGYPLSSTDPVANAQGGHAATTFGYRTALDGYIADLVDKTSPEGRRWTFARDRYGSLTALADPAENTPGNSAAGHSTRYRYDSHGEMVESTDANGHATRFADFTVSGYPRTTTDPLGNTTRTDYDTLGRVTAVTGPPDPGVAPRRTSYRYDVLGRPMGSTATVTGSRTITTPAPRYDDDDRVVLTTDPLGARTSTRYDEVGDTLTVTRPPNTTGPAPAPPTTYSYDPTGLLLSSTSPDGNAPGTPGSHRSRFVYDAMGELTESLDALGGRTTYRYDEVGNLIARTSPRGNADPDPASFTTTFGYDLDHRQTRTTDPTGAYRLQRYDLDGVETATTTQPVGADVGGSALEDRLTRIQPDPDGRPARVDVPYDRVGGLVQHSTEYSYDPVGNRTAVITPRAVAAHSDTAFIERFGYDADNRQTEDDLPCDPADPGYSHPDQTRTVYDAVGEPVEVSTPPSAGQTQRITTRSSYTANGWLATSTDPWSITTAYTYDDDGRQTVRTLTGDGNTAQRKAGWGYYPDGSLHVHSDSGAPDAGSVVVDDADPNATKAVGDWPTVDAGQAVNVEGPGYRTHQAASGPGTGSDTFTWNAFAPGTGSFRIAVRIPSGTGLPHPAADPGYTISADGTATTAHPGKPDPQGWAELGTTGTVAQNHTVSVTLDAAADGSVVADAIRLEPAHPTPVDPQAKSYSYQYDPDGNVTELHDSSADAPVGDYTAGYDQLDRPIRTQADGAGQPALDDSYDPDGNITTQHYGDRTDTFSYDHRDLPARSVNQPGGGAPAITTDYWFGPAGTTDHATEGNGDVLRDSYYLDGSLRDQTVDKSSGTLVASHDLDYDPDGDRIRDAARIMNADHHDAYLDTTAVYSYDPRDRITEVRTTGTGGPQTQSYVHDGNSNVTHQSLSGTVTDFSYDRNRLVGASSPGDGHYGYGYDSFGRLSTVTRGSSASAGGHPYARYSYDGFDRETEADLSTGDGGGGTDDTTFSYDSLDRQTSSTDDANGPDRSTVQHQYLGLGGTVVADLTTGHGAGSTDYFYSQEGDRLAQATHPGHGSSQTSYYGYNAHADVEDITDEHGDTRSTYGYTAYGDDDTPAFTGLDKPTPQGPAGPARPTGAGAAQPYNPYRFNAMRFDSGTAQYDMGFRDYAPGINSFLSRDSYQGALDDLSLSTDPWTSNRYAFGGGNPISGVELDGHDSTDDTSSGDTSSGGSAPVKKGPIPDQQPQDFWDQVAMGEAKAGVGQQIMANLGDEARLIANYGSGVWVKMQYVLRGYPTDAPDSAGGPQRPASVEPYEPVEGEGVGNPPSDVPLRTVHWFRNTAPEPGAATDKEFKFKPPKNPSPPRLNMNPPPESSSGSSATSSASGDAAAASDAAEAGGFARTASTALKIGGRVLAVLGIVAAVYDVVTAPPGQRVHTAVRDASSMAGALAGAEAGTVGGAEVGAVIGSIIPGAGTAAGAAIGAVVGGIGGAIAGSVVGRKVGDFLDSLF